MSITVKIEVKLDYKLAEPGPVMLLIEAAGTSEQELIHTSIEIKDIERFARVPAEEGIGEKILLRTAERVRCHYAAEILITRPQPDLASLASIEWDEMPGDALRYLLSSRYCQAERFHSFVTRHFGAISGGRKVVAMRDWIEDKLDYVPGVSSPDTTAVDTFVERRGVCRDHAHLMIAFCRAAAIPARFVSAFGPAVKPQDFHAVVEVYLDGAWHLVDPTGMATAEQLAVIAVGRDATDVAFLTTASSAQLVNQEVLVG